MHVEIGDHVRMTSDSTGAVLLDLERGVYLALNRSGAAIWTGLAEGREPSQIAATLAERHARPAEEMERDVNGFLGELARRGLVQIRG